MNQLTSVHPDARIGSNVKIETFATIQADVEIGDNTWIGSGAVIMNGSRIGKNCNVFPGAVVGGIPQDLKFQGEITTVEIGDNTTIRECVTLNRGTKARMRTIIGNNCLLMAYVHIGHDCQIGDYCILSNSVGLAGEVEVGDWAIIGAMSGVHQFTRIGKHVMISGMSKVMKDVPHYVKAGRDPLSYAGINSIGLRRRNFSAQKIEEIKEYYRYIYLKGLNRSAALEVIEKEFPESPERNEIIEFIRASKRGIIKGYFDSNSNEDPD
jgi:UDP-N-acetylglucosamine acyltransferase